jgi:multiple sugar transport system substrate-binding protein
MSLSRSAVLLGGAAALAGCGGTGDGRQQLHFWAMGREGEVVAQLIPDFERRHPDIRVRVQQIPWISAHEKLLSAFAGDATPDLAQLGSSWVPELVALGALEPLDARLRGAAAPDLGDYFQGPLDGDRIDGRLWSLPWNADTRLLFYRTDLLRAAGYERVP